MAQRILSHRRAFLLFAAAALAVSTIGAAAAQAAGENLLLFRPHCEKADQRQCPFYRVEDATSLGTPDLKVGDVLDMDIVVINPDKVPLRKVRTWLSYDSTILQGSGMTLNPVLMLRLPGEAEFSAAQGYVKIGAATDVGAEPTDEIFPVARVRFVVKAIPAGNKLPLSFYDYKPGTAGHTYVTSDAGDNAANILSSPTATLIAHIVPGAQTASSAATVSSAAVASSIPAVSSAAAASSVAVASSATASSIAPAALPSSSAATSVAPAASSSSRAAVAPAASFNVLQVQNVKIGTQNAEIYIGWDALQSPQVRAYNVYYGTTMGRYIQRRTVSAQTTAVIVRGLQNGTTYYASVRAVNEQGQESAFSQEVGVQVGNMNSSTSPMLVRPQDGSAFAADITPPGNPVSPTQTVPGESGLPSALAIMITLSAAAGTAIAARRQFVALPAPSHE